MKRPPSEYAARARARRLEAQRQAAENLMAGRTLATTPAEELSAEERTQRKAETARAFEGLS